jgi:enterochelin esterase-like enzyme
MHSRTFGSLVFLSALLLTSVIVLNAQAPAGRGGRGPVVVSPQVLQDRRVVVRLYSPQAKQVTVTGIVTPAVNLSKASDEGVWEATLGPVDPGAYRYGFQVDGTSVIDPRNVDMERMQVQVRSILYVPGAAFMDTRDVPHGAVALVNYYSKALGKFRRMHVYTPPGYEANQQKYPVLYLHHGANESDDSWWTVGRAGFILDNLIADGKAVPMIVVMPNGHTNQIPPNTGGAAAAPGAPPAAPPAARPADEYPGDFVTDILPYTESHYRVIADRPHRAIAGLSMGGSQTLNIAYSHLDQFSAIGVFSSGILGGQDPAVWEKAHLEALDNAALKKGLKTVWFSTGSDDPLLPTSKATVELLKKHGFPATFAESTGAHTWINWRNYLNQFAPLLFR